MPRCNGEDSRKILSLMQTDSRKQGTNQNDNQYAQKRCKQGFGIKDWDFAKKIPNGLEVVSK